MQGPLPWWLEEAPPDPEEPALTGYNGLWIAVTLPRVIGLRIGPR